MTVYRGKPAGGNDPAVLRERGPTEPGTPPPNLETPMYVHTVDYDKDRPDPKVLLHRGYFANGLPRLMPLCRAFGHKPVVDGYDSKYGDRDRARWIACDRCGVRPDPQGFLDPDEWDVGQPCTGPFSPGQPMSPTVRKQLLRTGNDAGIRQPGAWPTRPEGAIGAELVIGRSRSIGIGFKVGNAGSEQPLAAHIGLGRLGALYVHTERHGRGIQRRLNPTGFESRETEIDFHHGRVWWNVWAPRDEHKASDPKWMRGNANINPAHYLLGPRKGEIIDRTDKEPTTVHMPDGTTYDVTVQLEKWQRGRPRGKKTIHWTLTWDCGPGIPVRNHDWKGDEYFGGNMPFPTATAGAHQWVQAAAALIAEHCAADRARYNYRAPAA